MGNPLVTTHTFDPNQEQGPGSNIWSPKPYTAPGGGWTFSNNFEGGTLGQQTINGKAACVYSADEASSGTRSGKMTITAGSNGSTWGGGLNFGVNNLADVLHGDELWWRMRWFFPTSWSHACDPVYKVMRFTWNKGGHSGIVATSSGGFQYANETVGTPWYQGTVNADVGGRDSPGSFGAKGVWRTVELYIKIHSTDGQGVERVWVGGNLTFENSSVRTVPDNTYKISSTEFATYWNGGAPQTQSNYIDDIVWTTSTPGNTDAAGNPMIGV